MNTVLSTTAATESMQKTAERINQMPAFRPTAGPSNSSITDASALKKISRFECYKLFHT